jgi:rSAM/selenodomain-associated transferase 1
MKERLAVEDSLQKKKHETALLLFVKYPEKGKVKKRISVDIDETVVLKLYTNFVEDLLLQLQKIPATIIICFYPETYLTLFQQWLSPKYLYLAQQGKNLGERMKHCFQNTFAQGFEKVIVIGSDSPDLPLSFYNKAIDKLDSYDAIIGPCTDGGYYLYGCKKNTFISEMFSDIPWSTSKVFEKTMNVLIMKKLNIYQLPIWNDVDTYDDLVELAVKNKDNWFRNSKTMHFIKAIIDEQVKNE